MNTRIITYLSIACLVLILISQAYIIYDYFRLTQESLRRETNAVIDEAYHQELNQRDKKTHVKNQIIPAPPPPTKENTTEYNFDKMNVDKSDGIDLLNRAIQDVINKQKPLNLHNLDSITAVVLDKRGIESDFVVHIVNPTSRKIIESSKKEIEASVFVAASQYIPLDFVNQKSLQLVLINPMISILKRMGTLLAGSLILSLICFYGLWFLFLTLSRQRQLSAIKNDFFGHTAHELKRPVAQLYMALDALSRPAVDENKAKKERYLAISKEAAKDMSEKIGMIMTLSMAEEGVFKINHSEFDLSDLVSHMEEKFVAVADKDVTVQFEQKGQPCMVNADKDHITQCVANLIDNAIKYSKESVKIQISLSIEKNEIVLSVKDNGIGIPADKVNRVFEKYTRINNAPGTPSGFGIGLSYVKAVIDKHAGRIEVLSELSKGTEFKIYLPA